MSLRAPLLIAMLALAFGSASAQQEATIFQSDKLYIPTHVSKWDERYYIVACWQHRILSNRALDPNIAAWDTLDDQIAGAHSIIAHGDLLIAEDTGRHALRIYRKRGERHELVQTIEDLRARPHRILWDDASQAFWLLTSNNQQIHKFTLSDDPQRPLTLAYSKSLPFQQNIYTRSITIWDGLMYFISGPGHITAARYLDDSFEVERVIPLSGEIATLGAMNDLFRSSDGWWYATATLSGGADGAIIRAASLDALGRGEYEDIEALLGLQGVAYYLSEFDGRIWVPYIYSRNGILSFKHDANGQISDIRTFVDFGPATAADKARAEALPR